MARTLVRSTWVALAMVWAIGAGTACSRASGTATAATPSRSSTVGVPAVTLAFTASVRGWVEPCGCTADPLGGVDRIRGELDRLRAQGPTLFFDAGSLLFDRTTLPNAAMCQEEARIKLLLQSGRESGLALSTVGLFDLSRGEEWRAKTMGPSGVAVVSANIQSPGGIVSRKIVDVGGIKVGFTGVTWPADAAVPASSEAAMSWQGLALAHPVKSVAREAGALRQEGAKVVVLLGQMARGALAKLASDVPGIDLVIVGHEPGDEPAAPVEVARGTWMVSAGQQGQYLGKLTLKMPAGDQSCCLVYDDGGKSAKAEMQRLKKKAVDLEAQAKDFESRKDAANADARRKKASELLVQAAQLEKAPLASAEGNTFTFDAVPLSSKVAAEAVVTQQLRSYKDSLTALNQQCEKTITCAPAPAGSSAFVGSQACAACHQDAVDFWQKAIIKDPAFAKRNAATPDHPNKEGRMGHARAWQTLIDAKQTGNRDCIACHTVGFEKPGGFCKTTDANTWGNVGCESCHGPGSRHVESEDPKLIGKAVPETQCRGCHHFPHIPSEESFVYREKLRIILGPGHGEARLKELGGTP